MVAGADTFVFEGAFGDDVIYDFDVGLDRLALIGFQGVSEDDIVITAAPEVSGFLLDFTGVGGGTILLWDIAEMPAFDALLA